MNEIFISLESLKEIVEKAEHETGKRYDKTATIKIWSSDRMARWSCREHIAKTDCYDEELAIRSGYYYSGKEKYRFLHTIPKEEPVEGDYPPDLEYLE